MIELAILGGVRLTGGDPERLTGLLAQPKRVALLAYLTLARPRGFHSRDTLLALFWPELDSQHARWALNQSVHYLRGALGDSAVLRRGEDVSIDPARIHCDAVKLEDACSLHHWQKAIGLYQGELLPGLRPGGTVELEHWIDAERDRLRRLAADAASLRTDELAANDELPDAAKAARDSLRAAPGDETRVRRLIELLGVRSDGAGTSPAELRTARSRGSIWKVVGLTVVVALVGVVALAIRLATRASLAITATNLTQITDEPGVEYQPAISPDGKEVAFLVGPIPAATHIAIRTTDNNPAGGKARPTNVGFDSEWDPVWTGESDHLRYVGCRGLECAWYETGRLGGAVRPVALSAQAQSSALGDATAWALDDRRLVYAIRESIYVSGTADTSRARLIAVQPVAIARPHLFAWSPDGSLIAYEIGNAGWLAIGNLDRGSIWVVSSAGGTPRPVTTADHLNAFPAWMDNRHLLFVSDRDGARGVYVVEVGPNGARGAPRLIPGVADPHSISYAIGAQRLAWAKFTQRQNIRSYPLGRTAPVSVNDGVPITTSNQIVELLDVSPDGKWLVFDSNRRGNQDVYKLSLVNGALVALTSGPWDEAGPRWSPDGNFVAFHGARTNGTSSVMIVQTSGGEAPKALSNAPGLNGYPAWSPDGLHLVFNSTRSGHGQIWLLSRDSLRGAWHDAVLLRDDYYQVHDWAPDSRGILIGNDDSISVVSVQGQVLWTREYAALGLTSHLWARFSRDGRFIYMVGWHDGQRGVWAIPTDKGAPRLIVAEDDRDSRFEGGIAVSRDRIYLSVSQYESDIWTAKLTW